LSSFRSSIEVSSASSNGLDPTTSNSFILIFLAAATGWKGFEQIAFDSRAVDPEEFVGGEILPGDDS